jgi:rubrerythrin
MTILNDLLNEAMNCEIEEKNFYNEAVKKAQSKAGKKLFTELSELEQNHYEKVKNIIESLNNSSDINNDLHEPNQPLEIPDKEGEQESNKDEISTIINQAIESEKKAQERYSKIADMFEDTKTKKIFQYLAQDEQNHQKILEDEFYNLSNKGTIIWGE